MDFHVVSKLIAHVCQLMVHLQQMYLEALRLLAFPFLSGDCSKCLTILRKGNSAQMLSIGQRYKKLKGLKL